MLQSNGLFEDDTSSYEESIQSNVLSVADEISSQVSGISTPSAKSIYMQRKEYSVSMNKMMNDLRYRVEHLFTCDLDGKDMRCISDCVERLKLLDGMGRVWGQNMLMEVRGANLLLTDIETKEELESIALNDILELKAVLNGAVFNSLLTMSVQPGGKDTTSVFMFQCEEVRSDHVQKNLSRVLSRRREVQSISSDEGLVEGGAAISEPEEPAVDPTPQWTAPDYDEAYVPEDEPIVYSEEEEEEDEEDEEEASLSRVEVPSPLPPATVEEDEEQEEEEEEVEEVEEEEEEEPFPPPAPSYTELERNVDILNHVLSDIEIFMGQVAAVLAKHAKKKKKKKKGKALDGMPPAGEFADCLHKIKCGLNLLGELKGQIHNPSAADFVHSFFSTLTFVVSHCPDDLPPTIVAPLLTPHAIRLMSEEATEEEDTLWQSLGDAWNIPSTQWPEDDEDIPVYTLEFFDGWQPPDVIAAPEPKEPVSRKAVHKPATNQTAHKPAASQAAQKSATSQAAQKSATGQAAHKPATGQAAHKPATNQTSAKWAARPPPQTARSGESKLGCMHVKNDFTSRNHRELSITKGEIVELLDKSKLWWKVRNSRGEEGFVPNSALKADGEQPDEQTAGSPVLTKKSKPADVKAWLEQMGFSKITVRCLGVLNGSMLLGMGRDELKSVCPEEGGRVFLQLQAVKSAMTAAN